MSYVCTCANGKTWGAGNQGCNANAGNCAQCCAGEYGGVAGGMMFTETYGHNITKSFNVDYDKLKNKRETRKAKKKAWLNSREVVNK